MLAWFGLGEEDRVPPPTQHFPPPRPDPYRPVHAQATPAGYDPLPATRAHGSGGSDGGAGGDGGAGVAGVAAGGGGYSNSNNVRAAPSAAFAYTFWWAVGFTVLGLVASLALPAGGMTTPVPGAGPGEDPRDKLHDRNLITDDIA